MMHLRQGVVCGFATAILALSSSAIAQQAGSYSGTSADGNTISLTVTESGGTFSIANMSVGFVAKCKSTGLTASEGWGFFLGVPISGNSANFHSGNDYYDVTGNVTFPTNHGAKGAIVSRTAVFVPGTTPPAAAQFCISPNQQLHLTYQGPAGESVVPVGAAVAYSKPSNATSRMLVEPAR